MKNGFPAPNKELTINQKQLLDTKSPIQVRIHLPPAKSQERTVPLPEARTWIGRLMIARCRISDLSAEGVPSVSLAAKTNPGPAAGGSGALLLGAERTCGPPGPRVIAYRVKRFRERTGRHGRFAHRPLAARFLDDIWPRYPGGCGAFWWTGVPEVGLIAAAAVKILLPQHRPGEEEGPLDVAEEVAETLA